MKIVVDRNRCTGTGICESIADTYFQVGDDAALCVLHEEVQPPHRGKIEEAVRSCPTRALSLRD